MSSLPRQSSNSRELTSVTAGYQLSAVDGERVGAQNSVALRDQPVFRGAAWAVDQFGQAVDVLLSAHRDTPAAQGFATRALAYGPAPVQPRWARDAGVSEGQEAGESGAGC